MELKKKKMNALDTQSLHRTCGVSLTGEIRNEEIYRIAGTSEDDTVRMEKNVVWERKSIESMTKRFLREERTVRHRVLGHVKSMRFIFIHSLM